MAKSISFGGKRHKVANISMLMRHGPRKHIRKTKSQHLVQLTKEGEQASFEHSRKLPKHLKLKTYFSPSIRAGQTAHHARLGHEAEGGKAATAQRAKRVGKRQELLGKGNNLFLDANYADREFLRLNKDFEAFVRKWLDGKFPVSKIVPAKGLAREIIQKRLRLGARATKRGRRGWLIMNVSHDMHVMAVLAEFLGKNPYLLGFTLPKYNEGLTIFHTMQGKDIMEYMGKRFDVTQKLKKFTVARGG